MYRSIRTIHLCLGAFSVAFLLMYGISAVQMAHFNIAGKMTEERLTVTGEPAQNARALARELMDRGLVHGEIRDVKTTADGFDFQVERLAVEHEVSFASANGQVRIKTTDGGIMGTLNRIHHLGGLWRESAVLKAWGIFVGLVSTALILLSATGIYMWFNIHTERKIGAILLTVGVGFGVTLIVLVGAA